MHQYDPAHVPVISELAKAFGVSDRWHASAPCETWPNRYFLHAGTAGGYVNNERSHFPYRWPRFLPTIFRRLDHRGYSWRVYFHDLPQAATLIDLWPKIPTRFCLYDAEFERHALSGRLPNYSFIEPRYYPSRWEQSLPNDQHPPHDVRHGDRLIASVYNAVRAAPTWERTLLIIVYDEHGGCFDHAPPPAAVPPGGPYPDGFRFRPLWRPGAGRHRLAVRKTGQHRPAVRPSVNRRFPSTIAPSRRPCTSSSISGRH